MAVDAPGQADPQAYTKALKGARDQIAELIKTEGFQLAPIFLRLAFHDAGTFDKNVKGWPKCGGANGSIRFPAEWEAGANVGLPAIVKKLDAVKEKFPVLSFADIYQLSAHTAIWVMKGPEMTLNYGRMDAPAAKRATDNMLKLPGMPARPAWPTYSPYPTQP
jgi:L-ascorbate peroxidase